MTLTGDFSPSFWTRRLSDRGLSRPCYGARLQDVVFAVKWTYAPGPKSDEGASLFYRG